MLHKPESEKPKLSEQPETFAFAGNRVVRMRRGRFCTCGREYVASDWDAERGELICAGCHEPHFSVSSS